MKYMRFDDKSTREQRLQKDKLAAFSDIWLMFTSQLPSFSFLGQICVLTSNKLHIVEDVVSANISHPSQRNMALKYGGVVTPICRIHLLQIFI